MSQVDKLLELVSVPGLTAKVYKTEKPKSRSTPQHGTRVMYVKKGCRCVPCKLANAKWTRERREKLRENIDR